MWHYIGKVWTYGTVTWLLFMMAYIISQLV